MPSFLIASWIFSPLCLVCLTGSIRLQLWCMSVLYAWIWVWCGCVCLCVRLVYPSEPLSHVHDLSSGEARQRRACVMPFRLLQELSVTQGEVSGKERTQEASGGRLRGGHRSAEERWQLHLRLRARVTPEASALLVQWWALFNKCLTTRCKWCVIHKEPLMARALCFGLGLSNIYQLLKINIICYQLVFASLLALWFDL